MQEEARRTKERGLVRSLLAVGGARAAATGIVALRNIVLAAFLVPAEFGSWSAFLLVLRYGDHAHLGVRHALNREYPIAIGREDQDDARQVETAVFDWNLLFALIAGVAVIIVATTIFQDDRVLMWGLVVVGAIIIVRQLSSYFLTLLRVRKAFLQISIIIVVLEVAIMALIAGLWPLMGLFGGVLALGVPHAVVVIFLWRKYPRQLAGLSRRILRDGAMAARLFRVGLPILIFGYLSLVVLTLDRWVVLWQFDAATFGHYSFAALFISFFGMLSSVVGYVLLPTLGEHQGAGDHERLRVYLINLNRIIGIAAPPVAAVLAALVPIVVLAFFPQFDVAIPVAQILTAGAVFSVVASAAGQFMIVGGRYLQQGIIQVASVALKFVMCMAVLGLGGELVGVAFASTSGMLLFGGLMLVYALRDAALSRREMAGQLAVYVLPWAANFAALGLVQVWLPILITTEPELALSWRGLAASLAAILVVNVPMFLYLESRMQVFSRASTLLKMRYRALLRR